MNLLSNYFVYSVCMHLELYKGQERRFILEFEEAGFLLLVAPVSFI